MTQAFYGDTEFRIGDGGGPEVFTALEEVTDISGLGENLELIEATHFGSNGSKEYIAGLADGKEISVTCNHIMGAAQQAYVKTNKGTTGNIQVHYYDGTSTETYDFAAVFMGWELNPNVSDKNAIVFNFKISGGITQS